MTTVYLVRHAHADWQPDEARPLSARGRTSAVRLAEHFAALPVAAIYTSPARRALETVEPITHLFRLEPVAQRIQLGLRVRFLAQSQLS